jgi:hypothetical protein
MQRGRGHIRAFYRAFYNWLAARYPSKALEIRHNDCHRQRRKMFREVVAAVEAVKRIVGVTARVLSWHVLHQ